jgi:F5/8 type C domain
LSLLLQKNIINKRSISTCSLWLFALILFVPGITLYSQTIIDNFETTASWKVYKSDGVETNISLDNGHIGKAIRFDYNFTKGTGYGGIQKIFPIDLPDNYQFTFWIKAESPANNLEFKLLDSTGQSVWWKIERNYNFPTEWTKIKIKKRHIAYAWGPTKDKTPKKIDKLEFTISSYVGGKGTIWIDDFEFEKLPPEDNSPIVPIASASSELNPKFSVKNLADNNEETEWKSNNSENQNVIFDLQRRREFGGIVIDWDKENYAKDYNVYLSAGGKDWEKAYSVSDAVGNRSYIRLKEEDAEKIRLELLKSSGENGYGIREISIKNVDYSEDLNQFFINITKDYPRRYFPRYLNEEGTFWTIVGVNNDTKEALMNEDGMVEVDKKHFSIEPFLFTDGKFVTWNDVKKEQSLKDNYLPVPSVIWNYNVLQLEAKAFTNGAPNKNSVLYLSYSLTNNSLKEKKVNLYLAIRPFQVDPYYQQLNIIGGATEIDSIKYEDGKVFVNDDKVVIPITKPDDFGAAEFDKGDISSFISDGKIPAEKSVIDKRKYASGCLSYSFDLMPLETKTVYFAVPFYDYSINPENISREDVEKKLNETIDFWKSKVDHIRFNLPESADRIINTWKSNLAYILINRDNAGIQPGSRSYERSWIRDGALTSSALLKSGIVKEVKDFIYWYADHLYKNGKVPCVVDTRGPDPVPENDSNGEFIYLVKEYFNFTKDTAFLREMNEHVLKDVDYMDTLISQRTTDHFRNGNDSVRAYYGIMPQSISHEGYSAKPMHSFWDDFFTMKGLKDATEIERILGEKKSYERIKKFRDTFKENLYNSLRLAIKTRKIDYIPGCVELGDFDATSTTIAISPCNELANLPEPYARNTFDKYFEFFKNRRDNKIDWTGYTPYENRLIGSFIFLDQPERAHELIKFFLNDQKPQSWNEWAEVVWKNERNPGYIGDMPHTWVGSDFINSVRSMFVYENEFDSSIVIGAALYKDWINSPNGMSVENLPTYYGELSYSIKKNGNKYSIKFYGNISLPPGGLIIKNFPVDKTPFSVTVNGNSIKGFDKNNIRVNQFPATIEITY